LKKKAEKPEALALGYHQCEWTANGLRCQYPGTTSHNLSTDPDRNTSRGPWFCRAHAAMPDGHIGAQIVEASFKFRRAIPETEHDRKMLEDLKAWGLGQLAGETHHEWCMRMRDVALSKMPLQFHDPGLSWTQRLVEEARAGKKLQPIQEAMLLKALNLSRAELHELIWSAAEKVAS
jgi:hypothetical protein